MPEPTRHPCIVVGYDGSAASRAALAIAKVAAVRDADEIVVGSRGFGRVRALLGSVAHELIHLADRPVTVIPERSIAQADDETAAAA